MSGGSTSSPLPRMPPRREKGKTLSVLHLWNGQNEHLLACQESLRSKELVMNTKIIWGRTQH